MAKILGKPMIEHVYKNVSKCDLLSKTIVATCDIEIANFIDSIGGESVMTSDRHEELLIVVLRRSLKLKILMELNMTS